MPFRPSSDPVQLATPGGLDLRPEHRDVSFLETLGPAFRTDNTVGSLIASEERRVGAVDPDFSPWEELQGTGLEFQWEAFVGVRNREEFGLVESQVLREMRDRELLAEAGFNGFLGSMVATALDPVNLLPGGVGVGAVRAGATAGRVAGRAAVAGGVASTAAEGALHSSQKLRTAEESLVAIGGSVVLSGLLGGAAGKLMSRAEFAQASRQLETGPLVAQDLAREVGELQSMGAAATGPADLTLRREGAFEFMRKFPGGYLGDVARKLGHEGIGEALDYAAPLAPLTRADPLLRSVLSEFQTVRRTAAELVETPLQYRANEKGEAVVPGGSLEQVVKARRYADMSAMLSGLNRIYGEYFRNGPVGMVGQVTAPLEGWTAHLLGRREKLTLGQFMDEVGTALTHREAHPIPEVAQAASLIRERIFKRVAREAEEVGLWDALPERPRHAESYFTRVYLREKIVRYRNDGSADDLGETLFREFKRRQSADERKARAAGKPFQPLDDAEIRSAVDDTVDSIVGLKEGQHHFGSAVAKPIRARVLDLPDDVLAPWLERNAAVVVDSYLRSVIPDIELRRRFGTIDFKQSEAHRRMQEELSARTRAASSPRERQRIDADFRARVADIEGMWDRIRGVYGVPTNPQSVWVRAGRAARTTSYTGFLGATMIASMPDLGNLLSRVGLRAWGDSIADAATAPRRLLKAKADILDLNAAADWYLNARVNAIGDITDPYAAGSRFEKGLGFVGQKFSRVNLMAQWNTSWKSIGGVMVMSRMLKAARAVAAGTATKAQLTKLAEGGIDRTLAVRIARQAEEFGDRDGRLWFANAGLWQDRAAFEAFRAAMTREIDLLVITPGQDKPLWFSSELGRLFFQFKSFPLAANHRILLSGIQRADADMLAGALVMLFVGGMVSDLRAWISDRPSKKGAAWWADALDRSGMAGFLFEVNATAELGGFGVSSLTGSPVSRFQSRSQLLGLAGPSVDNLKSWQETAAAISRGDLRQSDIGQAMNVLPGNNIPWFIGVNNAIEEGLTGLTGATPRQDR